MKKIFFTAITLVANSFAGNANTNMIANKHVLAMKQSCAQQAMETMQTMEDEGGCMDSSEYNYYYSLIYNACIGQKK